MSRFLANILLFISVVLFPWWIAALVGIMCAFLFRSFFELVFWAAALDVLYGTPIASLGGINMIASLGALAMLALIEPLKGEIRFLNF